MKRELARLIIIAIVGGYELLRYLDHQLSQPGGWSRADEVAWRIYLEAKGP